MKSFFTSLFSDEKGATSSKRICGMLCILFLNVTLLVNTFTHGDIKPSDMLVQTVGLLAFGCLGLTTIDKYTKNKFLK